MKSKFRAWKFTISCLTLNVLVPRNIKNASVVVYIHGGAFNVGISYEKIVLGDFFANRTNTIFVSMNYRVGALGFLDGLGETGNFGIMDQRLAVEWVHENIEFFGGNKNDITLSGHSAGAMSVIVHMVSPKMKNIFKKVILLGTPFAVQYRKHDANAIYSKMFALNLQCKLDDRECYLRKSVSEIIKAQSDTVMIPHPPLLNTRNVLPWLPTIDGIELTDQPLRLFKQGKCKNVTVLLGETRDEFTPFLFNAVKFKLEKWQYTSLAGVWMLLHAFEFLRIYPTVHDDARHTATHASSDYYFHCGARIASSALSKFMPVYFYSFQYPPRADPSFSSVIQCVTNNYTCHGAELSFTFGTYPLYRIQRNEQEIALSNTMMRYFGSFIQGNTLDLPRYEDKTDLLMAFDLKSRIIPNYKKRQCDFWEKAGDYFSST